MTADLHTTGVAGDARAMAAQGVTLRIGGHTLLEGIDLDVRHGRMTALVGPNGAGKSTLLGVLAGDLPPQEGTVELEGSPLSRQKLGDLARLRAVLGQFHQVAFPFTVREVVAMGRAPWAGSPGHDHDEALVDAAVAATEIGHLEHRTFQTLSGGERARVSFSRALAQRTGILLLDEPTAAMDLRHQEIVLGLARAAADAGAAVVVVLHDLALAAAWADEIVLLAAGRVRARGVPAEVLTAERIGEVYGQPVLVHAHPVTGDLVVTPDRRVPHPLVDLDDAVPPAGEPTPATADRRNP